MVVLPLSGFLLSSRFGQQGAHLGILLRMPFFLSPCSAPTVKAKTVTPAVLGTRQGRESGQPTRQSPLTSPHLGPSCRPLGEGWVAGDWAEKCSGAWFLMDLTCAPPRSVAFCSGSGLPRMAFPCCRRLGMRGLSGSRSDAGRPWGREFAWPSLGMATNVCPIAYLDCARLVCPPPFCNSVLGCCCFPGPPVTWLGVRGLDISALLASVQSSITLSWH